MRTIEQLLKPVIKEDINYLLGLENKDPQYSLKLTENSNIQDKNNTMYDIQGIIKFGQGLLTQIPGAKAVQTPLQLIFQIPLNYQHDFIKIINTYILTSNAVWSEVTDDFEDDDTSTSETYQYRLVWRSPSVSDTPFSVSVKSIDSNFDNESIEMVHVILIGDVTSTSSFAMDDEELYLWLEDAVDSTEKAWLSSDSSYWDLQLESNRDTHIASDPADLSAPSSYDPDTYDEGFALKVTDGAVPETAEYYILGLNDIVIDGYVQIQGITAESEPLQPTLNQTQIISQRNPSIDVNGDSQVLNVTVAVQTSNILHRRLIELFYSNARTNATYDMTVKRVRKSIGITRTGVEYTMSLNRYKQNGFEYLQITLSRK